MSIRYYFVIALLFAGSNHVNIRAQQNHLDVEGHLKIRGNIDIANMVDTTSVLIGINTVSNLIGSQRKTTIVGADAGSPSEIGSGNSYFGYRAGSSGDQGSNNSFFGVRAGEQTQFSDNAFFGYLAGQMNTNSTSNSYFGSQAGEQATTGANSFFGYQAGQFTSERFNSFFGYKSGQQGGKDCAFFGYESGLVNTASNNSMFGFRAGKATTTGFNNVFLGYQAAFSNQSGSRSVVLGASAADCDDAISNSVYIGYKAGSLCQGGGARSGNIFIGYEAGELEFESNRLYIENSDADSANALIYGEFDNDLLRVNGELNVMGTGGGDGNIVLDNKGDISFITLGGAKKAVLTLHSDDHTYLDAANDLVFRSGGLSVGMRIEADGEVVISDLAGAGTADVQVDATGRLMRAASDRRLKEDIQSIAGALDKVVRLRGVSYNWKDRPNPTKALGVVAQEVLEVVPEIVTSDGEYYGVNYSQLPALLIEAIKEQQIQIDRLAAAQKENDQLKIQLREMMDRLGRLESIN